MQVERGGHAAVGVEDDDADRAAVEMAAHPLAVDPFHFLPLRVGRFGHLEMVVGEPDGDEILR